MGKWIKAGIVGAGLVAAAGVAAYVRRSRQVSNGIEQIVDQLRAAQKGDVWQLKVKQVPETGTYFPIVVVDSVAGKDITVSRVWPNGSVFCREVRDKAIFNATEFYSHYRYVGGEVVTPKH